MNKLIFSILIWAGIVLLFSGCVVVTITEDLQNPFIITIKWNDVELEPDTKTPVKVNHSKPGGAESGALGAENGPDSGAPGSAGPELQAIIRAWPTLPADVRAAILAMVNAATDRGKGGLNL